MKYFPFQYKKEMYLVDQSFLTAEPQLKMY